MKRAIIKQKVERVDRKDRYEKKPTYSEKVKENIQFSTMLIRLKRMQNIIFVFVFRKVATQTLPFWYWFSAALLASLPLPMA